MFGEKVGMETVVSGCLCDDNEDSYADANADAALTSNYPKVL